MKYKPIVVAADDFTVLSDELEKISNKLIQSGWTPLGGPSISHGIMATNSYGGFKYIITQGFTKNE